MTTPTPSIPTTTHPEPRWCDGCQNYVPQVRTPSGEWLCAEGHNMTAACEREMQLSASVGDAIRTFLGVSQEERQKWMLIFVAELGPVAQDLAKAMKESGL